MAGLRLDRIEDRLCPSCNNVDTLVCDNGCVVCDECGIVLSENGVGESLEYANTHNAPLDKNMRTRFVLLNGRRIEIEVKSRWRALVANDLDRIAHSKDHAVGEDVVKCAIELIDEVDSLKNADGTRVFRCVPVCTRIRITWALIKLAHDLCFIYTTVEDLFTACDVGELDVTVKSVNKMVETLRGPLHVESYSPNEKDHVSAQVRRALAQEVRQAEESKALDRRALTALVHNKQQKVMSMWRALESHKLYDVQFKVKRDPTLLLKVYSSRTVKTVSGKVTKMATGRGARALVSALTATGFDFGTIL